MMRKTISMPDTMGKWVAVRIERGQYNNESEYFRDLVRQDQQEEERMRYLMARLDNGERQLAEGAYTDLNDDQDIDALFDKIESETTQT